MTEKSATNSVLALAIYMLVALHASYFLDILTNKIVTAYNRSTFDEGRGDLIMYNEPTEVVETYSTLATFTAAGVDEWVIESVLETVPVVFYWGSPGPIPCSPGHHSQVTVEQALKLNSVVHFIGPADCYSLFTGMGVYYHAYEEYEDVFEWFLKNIGTPVDLHVRWFILKSFLEKSKYSRVMFVNTEVMLYTNATEAAAWLYPSAHIVLPVRWPSLRPPMRANQYPSIAVAGHMALFSYEGLSDWCLFLWGVFHVKLFGLPRLSNGSFSFSSTNAATHLPLLPAYTDMQALGLYTFAECWQEIGVGPPCAGMAKPLLRRLRSQFKARFRVESFCQPRACHNSSWSEEGECVFDNNFSVATSTSYFHFPPGQKTPTSMSYAYYEAWAGRQQREALQFLAVHFHAKRKELLVLPNRGPHGTWGSARF